MSKSLFRSGAPSPGEAGDARGAPVLWIRMLDRMYVKGNFTALRVNAGAVLRVQRGRDDRDFDVPFDKALDLIAGEFAEEFKVAEEAAGPDEEPGAGDPLGALWEAVQGLQEVLGEIASLADDGTVPPSRRLPAIAARASEAARRPVGSTAKVAGKKGSWNGR